MPNTVGKNLNLCFSLLLKGSQPQLTTTNTPQNHHLNIQNHPNNNNNSPFTKNYNSLYEDFPPHHTTTTTSAPASPSSVSTDYMETEDITEAVGSTTPDLTAIYASRRFFISSPGRSNSIVDSLSLSSSTLFSPAEESSSTSSAEVAGGVPVQTYSPNPYMDFRRSMQEMVDARELMNLEVKEAWEYLQELLLSYLGLNPKNTHKYIVGAFTDLVVSLMSPNNDKTNNDCSSSLSSFSSCAEKASDDDHHHSNE